MPVNPRKRVNGAQTPLARNLQQLLSMIGPVPKSWEEGIPGIKAAAEDSSEKFLDPKECTSYSELLEAWKVAMRWTDGLNKGLSAMLACVASTQTLGDQLWLKIISPPSTGKSTLCEAISVAQKYVLAKSTLTGFFSGFRESSEDGEDHSLISQVDRKTLIIKDGDTLLQNPAVKDILGQARDIYDGNTRTYYKNNASKDYMGIKMSWLLCGTSSLTQLDSSELGERFLDVVLMNGVDHELEDEVLRMVVKKALKNMRSQSDETAQSQQAPEMTHAMQLTGGYVEHLRKTAEASLDSLEMDEEAQTTCINFGKYVAQMRARPSMFQKENDEREFSPRLVNQHLKLATCLAIVWNKSSVDSEVLEMVRNVALDTGRGTTARMAEILYEIPEGCTATQVAEGANIHPNECKRLLRYLKNIEVITSETRRSSQRRTASAKTYWSLTDLFRKLYKDVHKDYGKKRVLTNSRR